MSAKVLVVEDEEPISQLLAYTGASIAMPLIGLLDSARAGACLGHVEIVGGGQLFGQGLAQVFLVIDQQDFFQSGHVASLRLLRE